jgi:Skp family chaperone for outer membrane proteins
MKKLSHKVVLAIGLLFFVHAGFAADQKIATVDLLKVFNKYYKTVQSSGAISNEIADIQKERNQLVDAEKKGEDEWRKLVDKAGDQAISADERDKGKKAAQQKYNELESDKQSIDEFDKRALARLRETQRQRRDDIYKEIVNVLRAQAKVAGYNLVLDVSGNSDNIAPIVLYSDGKLDMTDALIKELNAAAPAAFQDAAPATSPKETPSGK